MKKIKVLYIDDERLNLLAFKASYRRDFEVFTATSAEEGIKILNNNSVEVIMADQRMPGTTGVNFFASILETHPNPIRILITAYSDINAIIDAINKGKVYRYITKPWNELELKSAIENAYKIYLLKEQNASLSRKYQKIFTESTDPIILFNTLGKIIDYNQSAVKLLNFSPQKLQSTYFSELITDRDDALSLLRIIAEKGTVKDYECQIKTEDNSIKTCLISGNSITNNYKKIEGYQAIIKDVSVLKEIEKNNLKTIIETQENERVRIAQELHDSLGQKLTAIKINLNLLQNKIPENLKENTSDEFLEIQKILNSSISEIRTICFNLMPVMLKSKSLTSLVEESIFNAEQFKEAEYDLNIEGEEPDLQINFKISVFRVIQEFVHNSLKHSEADKISLTIFFKKDSLHLFLRDNGKGFDFEKELENPTGNGINNIVSRIKAFEGRYKFTSKMANFTELEIHFLLNNKQNGK